MRKNRNYSLIKSVAIMTAGIILAVSMRTSAAEFEEPTRIRCTTYTSTAGKVTYSGVPARQGILAGKKEWIGKTAILYDEEMNIIGYFEFMDTGATNGLNNGTVIDVYRDSLDNCNKWIRDYGDYVYLQIVD